MFDARAKYRYESAFQGLAVWRGAHATDPLRYITRAPARSSSYSVVAPSLELGASYYVGRSNGLLRKEQRASKEISSFFHPSIHLRTMNSLPLQPAAPPASQSPQAGFSPVTR